MRVGIVGGGITGLALTHALAERGVGSVLFEKSERFGGVIETRREGGRVVELGPQRTRLVPPMRRLFAELDLADHVVEARPGLRLFVWARGRLRPVPRSIRELATGDLLTPLGRARALCEPLTGGPRVGESVADYFRRKAGDEAYRALFGPLISATFGSDPAVMPAVRALPMLLDPLGVRRSLLMGARRWRPEGHAPACTFADGLSALTDALAARHADRVRCATPVEGIRRSAGGFELTLAGAGAGTVAVDEILMTTAAPDAAPLLRDIAPDAARRLQTLRYHRVSVVPLEVESTPEGFGFQVALGERWRTRGVTWAASLFGRTGSCTAYLGGGLDPEVETWSRDRVMSTASEEYEAIHGLEARPLALARPWLPAYDASWSALDGLELPAGVTLAASYTGRLGISGRVAQAEAVADRIAAR